MGQDSEGGNNVFQKCVCCDRSSLFFQGDSIFEFAIQICDQLYEPVAASGFRNRIDDVHKYKFKSTICLK